MKAYGTRTALRACWWLAAVVLLLGVLPASAQNPWIEFTWGGPEPPVEPGLAADKLSQLSDLDAIDLSTGGLSLRIPIGLSYPVSSMSYALSLTYSSEIWQHATRIEDGSPGVECDRLYHQSFPTLRSNAGLGWTVTMATLMAPDNAENPLPPEPLPPGMPPRPEL